MYLTITKSLENAFLIEKNNAKISAAVFLFILIWTSGPLKIVFKLNNYKIEISYDGSLFHGFQKQLNVRTVQSKLKIL